mmetsp:Transcript_10641/g.23633  ORF Transcript_10641/g.23633 Transcript_10641/m.23633 type:complete len:292 (-) Transcript_10641:375-1250(-)
MTCHRLVFNFRQRLELFFGEHVAPGGSASVFARRGIVTIQPRGSGRHVLQSNDVALFVAAQVKAAAAGVPQVASATAGRADQNGKQQDAEPREDFGSVVIVVQRPLVVVVRGVIRKGNGEGPVLIVVHQKAGIATGPRHAHSRINARRVSVRHVDNSQILTNASAATAAIGLQPHQGNGAGIGRIHHEEFQSMADALLNFLRHPSLLFRRTTIDADKEGHGQLRRRRGFAGGGNDYGRMVVHERDVGFGELTQPRIVGGEHEIVGSGRTFQRIPKSGHFGDVIDGKAPTNR